MILYNGDVPWWAPLNVFDLIHWVPESFAAHIPSMKCILIDEKRCRPEDLAALQKNVVAAIVLVNKPKARRRWAGLSGTWRTG